MKIFEKKREGQRTVFYFCGKKCLSYPQNTNSISYFNSLNFYNEYKNGKIIKSEEKSGLCKLKYLQQYIYALNNNLEIKISDNYAQPIWQLWLQGRENIPALIKICMDSVRKYNPDRNIIILTKDNLRNYVDLPEYIWQKYEAGIITHTHFSDIIRFYLLYKYGGTWADATVLMTSSMPDFIKNTDLFVFKDLTSSLIKPETTLEQFVIINNMRDFGPWTNSVSFIHAKRGNELIEKNLKLMYEYWKYENKMYDYLLVSYFFTLVIFSSKKTKEDFIKVPYIISTNEYGAMQGCLYEHFDKEMIKQILNLTPIHKLTYKNSDKNIFEDSLLNEILKQGIDKIIKACNDSVTENQNV